MPEDAAGLVDWLCRQKKFVEATLCIALFAALVKTQTDSPLPVSGLSQDMVAFLQPHLNEIGVFIQPDEKYPTLLCAVRKW